MRRSLARNPSLAAAALVWALALAAVIAVTIVAGWSGAAPGYFAGWLVAVSLPLGALPILMVLDLFALPETPVATALRVLLAGLPILAVLIAPALFDLGGIFPWPAGSHLAPAAAAPLKGLARHWFAPGFFGLRAIGYLVVWVVLSLFFVRPPSHHRRHRITAGIGLAVHAVVGTLAAFDWWMSLDAGFTSSGYGLLVIAAQATFALTVASLVVFASERAVPDRPVLLVLLCVLFVAAFVQFSQFLVIWSANLPKEIAWYQARWVGALGPIFVIGVPLLMALAFALLIPASLAAFRPPVLLALGAILLVVVLDLACLASPHGSFTFAGFGLVVAFLIVLGGLGAGCATLLGGRMVKDLRRV